MLAPTLCWVARHKIKHRKQDHEERPAPRDVCAEPLNALRQTRMQCAEIENEYLRRLAHEAHKK